MGNPVYENLKAFDAGGTIADKRFVKFGSSDMNVVVATAATDAIIGVSHCPGGVVSGDRCPVVMRGIADVEFGGAVTRGLPVTADSAGKAVAAAPSAGANARVAGFAYESVTSDGTIARVDLSKHTMQGA